MLSTVLALAAPLAAAEPLAGIAWRPLGRADLVQVAENRTSGVGVGEFDGVVRPNLQVFGGAWTRGALGVVGSLGVAHLSTRTFVGDDVTRRAWTVVRPAIDLRLRPTPAPAGPAVWAVLSLYADVPAATDRSTAYSEADQEAANRGAREDRARLGGIGGQLGGAAEIALRPDLSLGVQAGIGLHRGVLRTTAAVSVSTWVATDAALLLTFRWPIRDG